MNWLSLAAIQRIAAVAFSMAALAAMVTSLPAADPCANFNNAAQGSCLDTETEKLLAELERQLALKNGEVFLHKWTTEQRLLYTTSAVDSLLELQTFVNNRQGYYPGPDRVCLVRLAPKRVMEAAAPFAAIHPDLLKRPMEELVFRTVLELCPA
jgi:hypothetical protein